MPPLSGSYKGLATGILGIWWPLSFLWLDKVAQLLLSFLTDAANGGGWGGVSLCGQIGNVIFTRVRPGPHQCETLRYIKLHSVFSVLLLELLFTGTTQPIALPQVHGEPSSNCPHSQSASRLSRAGFFRTYWWCFWQNDFPFPVKSHHIRKANNLWWETTCAVNLPSRELRSGQAKFRDEQFGALCLPSLPYR